MRDLIDIIKKLEAGDITVGAVVKADPLKVDDVAHEVQDQAAEVNGLARDTDTDYEVRVDADTVTGRTDSDEVYYVGDQEANVSQPKRNNVSKYGRKFQF